MFSYKIILYKQKTLANGKHPVMFQAIDNGRVKRFSLGIRSKPKDWRRVKKSEIVESTMLLADSIVMQAKLQRKRISIEELFQQMRNDKSTSDVFGFLDDRIEELKQSNKIGNANVHHALRLSLRGYIPSRHLKFSDVNYTFLSNYEKYLRQRECTNGGINNYMRTLRALYNEAIRRNLAEQTDYPFSTQFNKKGYSLSHLKSSYKPRALSEKDLKTIMNFQPPKHLILWHDMFMFSFFCRGINFVDMAYLKWDKNIKEDRMTYTRRKTNKNYNVKLIQPALDILEKYKGGKDGFVFPILFKRHKTAAQQKARLIKKLKHFNDSLKDIATRCSIKDRLTSYVARHSYATTLKRKGVSNSIISESMGHSSELVTKHYLENFENKVLDEANDVLLSV